MALGFSGVGRRGDLVGNEVGGDDDEERGEDDDGDDGDDEDDDDDEDDEDDEEGDGGQETAPEGAGTYEVETSVERSESRPGSTTVDRFQVNKRRSKRLRVLDCNRASEAFFL